MDIKKDILWRVYLSFVFVVIVAAAIIGKGFYIQQVQGKYWRSMSDSLHQRIADIDSERGTIYSEDGQMLSTSVPQFDIYMDFRVEPLHVNNGYLFREHIDSLSYYMADLFKDQSAEDYKSMFAQAYKNNEGYFLLKKKISFREYQKIQNFPLFKLGRYKSGMIAVEKSIRLNPYKSLAYRTIGLARDNNKVGLEYSYDSVLRGINGKQLVRTIAGGVGVPLDADTYEIEPENGKDVVSTIDVFIQEVAENALQKMMIKNEAEHGTAIVLEVKTGKVKAIANLGRGQDGNYYENYNYAISPSEPGSTFKLATMLALLEDKKVGLNNMVNITGGSWRVFGQTVYDSEDHGYTDVTVQHSFEVSSNVAMAKLAVQHYGNNPMQYINHLKKMGMDNPTGIDLSGEGRPLIYKPGHKLWGPTSLPWMAFGYNLLVSPLQTANLYNAVANNGKMMKPYLVSAIKEEGVLLREIQPKVMTEKICSDQTLADLKTCLEGVCLHGTATTLFKGSPYKVAGKTGTALIANGNKGYADKIYQSSFAGYFPADNPQYTCIVVIKNKPHAPVFYGAAVAGPVFKEIADRLYSASVKQAPIAKTAPKPDSNVYVYKGYKQDVATVAKKLKLPFKDSSLFVDEWATISHAPAAGLLKSSKVDTKSMPSLVGLGYKDMIYICESAGLKVYAQGRGKVAAQSIAAGQPIVKGQQIQITLN